MDVSISKKVREAVLIRDSVEDAPCCINCGSPYYLHLHHYVERSRGGMGIEENLVTLCNACHMGLHNGNEEIKDVCKEYLANCYEGWNEERLVYNKWLKLK